MPKGKRAKTRASAASTATAARDMLAVPASELIDAATTADATFAESLRAVSPALSAFPGDDADKARRGGTRATAGSTSASITSSRRGGGDASSFGHDGDGALIYVVRSFLTPEECDSCIAWADSIGFERSLQRETRYAAHRDNGRLARNDPELAGLLWDRVRPLLPERVAGRAPCGLNPNVRFYKYTAGQAFGPHIDEAVDEPDGSRTEYTMLMYLNGRGGSQERDRELRGGATVFYSPYSSDGGDAPAGDDDDDDGGKGRRKGGKGGKGSKAGKRGGKRGGEVGTGAGAGAGAGGNETSPSRRGHVAYAFEPEAGAALLHGHGSRCLMHEGAPVTGGAKYLMRTDVKYK